MLLTISASEYPWTGNKLSINHFVSLITCTSVCDLGVKTAVNKCDHDIDKHSEIIMDIDSSVTDCDSNHVLYFTTYHKQVFCLPLLFNV